VNNFQPQHFGTPKKLAPGAVVASAPSPKYGPEFAPIAIGRYRSVLRSNRRSFNFENSNIVYNMYMILSSDGKLIAIKMKMNKVQFHNNFNSSILIFLFLFFVI
jgi:hypothetical protein